MPEGVRCVRGEATHAEPARKGPNELRRTLESDIAAIDRVREPDATQQDPAEHLLVDDHDEVRWRTRVVETELGFGSGNNEPVDLGPPGELEPDCDSLGRQAVELEEGVDRLHEVRRVAMLAAELDPVLRPYPKVVQHLLKLASSLSRVIRPTPPRSVGPALQNAGGLERPQPFGQQALRDPADTPLDLAEVVVVEEHDLAQDQRRPALGDHLAGERDRTDLLVTHEASVAQVARDASADFVGATPGIALAPRRSRGERGLEVDRLHVSGPCVNGCCPIRLVPGRVLIIVDRLPKVLMWPVVSLLITGGLHFSLEAIWPDLKNTFIPAVLAPVLLAYGFWVGYRMIQTGGDYIQAIVAGAILGVLPIVLDVVGFGIILGRGTQAGTLAGIFGFSMVLFGSLIGSGFVLSRDSGTGR